MNLSFNYYHKLDDIDLYLCNPDGKELCVINAYDRNVTLRFNDLSTLDFSVPFKVTKSDGTVVENTECYNQIESLRLVYATGIGYFQIADVSENDSGASKYKTVQAESLQRVFKHKGFVSEDRVYKFFDPVDPMDNNYSYLSSLPIKTVEDEERYHSLMPSVVGQLCTQLGIKIDLDQGLEEPRSPYEYWTITYINPSLIYGGENAIARSMKSNTTYGYDWIVNDVENTFKVVFIFDFLNKAIQIKTTEEITEQANVCLSFHNFMRNIEVNENTQDITTVLSCNGDGVNITNVNPTGTNYIVDFSYYMQPGWMSNPLIDKIKSWQKEVDTYKPSYIEGTSRLQGLYREKEELEAKLAPLSLAIDDLKAVRDKYVITPDADVGMAPLCIAEKVAEGEFSADKRSVLFASTTFDRNETMSAYKDKPTYNFKTKMWLPPDSGSRSDTAADLWGSEFRYFFDTNGDKKSYCELTESTTVDADSGTSDTYCSGFTRWITYNEASDWISIKENQVKEINGAIERIDINIDEVVEYLREISSRLNIISYFSDTPDLLRELYCYWIEGEYTDDNLTVFDTTEPSEAIEIAKELLAVGELELSKICQPKYSFSVEATSILKQYKFKDQVAELQLGKVVPVEKEEGLWYYPALLEMSFSLDNNDDFTMTFANKLRLDDWGYTYADLISEASSTSRQVSANWQNITGYSKDKSSLSALAKNPLDATLRASYANAVNQEFTVDSTGILGRKYHEGNGVDGVFEGEQVRMINNMIIFTDDNWATAKTALGKIYIPDLDETRYGLVGEAIIGDLIMGKQLKIRNDNSTVELGEEGITIKKKNSDNTYSVVFSAKPDGSAEFAGRLSAAIGTFGISQYPFNIGTGSDSAKSPCLYSRDSSFAGCGGYGIVSDNYVYIGGDGFSYHGGDDPVHDYNTAIRPGVVFCSGDNSNDQDHNTACVYTNRGITFCYGGGTNLRDDALSHKMAEMTVTSTGIHMVGTFTGDSSGSIVSDSNKKHNILPMDSKYEMLYDSLKPVTYQYNNGASGRIHTGFIAQDVLQSITNSGLTTMDFAAYVETIDLDDSVVCGLRYEEFVSLNTWQIQKLKSRVSLAEEKLAKLEAEYSELKEKISGLI